MRWRTTVPRPPFNLLDFLKRAILGRGGVVEHNWISRGRPSTWAPLKKSTVKQKVRLGYKGVADNTRTGKLQRDARNPGYIHHGPRLTVFRIPISQSSYAGFINNGTKKMVARRFYHIPLRDWKLLNDAIADELLEEAGF